MTNAPSDDEVLRYSAKLGRHPAQLFSRLAVREVTCPYCHAGPGVRCFGTSGPRESNHTDRCFERVRLSMRTQSGTH
jgi:hypothetical protein